MNYPLHTGFFLYPRVHYIVEFGELMFSLRCMGMIKLNFPFTYQTYSAFFNYQQVSNYINFRVPLILTPLSV